MEASVDSCMYGGAAMAHYRMPLLEETGYAVLDSYGGVIPLSG